MEFPQDFDIEHKGQLLKMLVLDGASLAQVDPSIHDSTDEAYEFCFKHPTKNILHSLNHYKIRTGCSIILFDPEKKQTHFVLTLVYCPEMKSVEIYNVCKYRHSPISANDFLGIVFDDFCLDNPLFEDCRYLNLAMLCKSVYFFPAFMSYCKLGFRVDSPIQKLSSPLESHFTMSRPLIRGQPVSPSDPEEEILKIHNGCFFSRKHLDLLEESIIQKKKEINYDSLPNDQDTDKLVLPTKSDMLAGLQQLRKVMLQHKPLGKK